MPVPHDHNRHSNTLALWRKVTHIPVAWRTERRAHRRRRRYPALRCPFRCSPPACCMRACSGTVQLGRGHCCGRRRRAGGQGRTGCCTRTHPTCCCRYGSAGLCTGAWWRGQLQQGRGNASSAAHDTAVEGPGAAPPVPLMCIPLLRVTARGWHGTHRVRGGMAGGRLGARPLWWVPRGARVAGGWRGCSVLAWWLALRSFRLVLNRAHLARALLEGGTLHGPGPRRDYLSLLISSSLLGRVECAVVAAVGPARTSAET